MSMAIKTNGSGNTRKKIADMFKSGEKKIEGILVDYRGFLNPVFHSPGEADVDHTEAFYLFICKQKGGGYATKQSMERAGTKILEDLVGNGFAGNILCEMDYTWADRAMIDKLSRLVSGER